MATRDIPIGLRDFYRKIKEDKKIQLEKLNEKRLVLKDKIRIEHDKLKVQIDFFLKEHKFNLNLYKEFVNNKYIDGSFYKIAKGLFINKRGEYQLISDLLDIFNYARHQKELYELEHKIELYQKIIDMNDKDFARVLRTFYTEVHRQLILEGKGYAFGHNIGWICVNRCKIQKRKPILDWKASAKRKEEIIKSGQRIYNKDEAEWCAKNGIEYNYVDHRVFRCEDYCYEIPLLDSKLKGSHHLKLETSDYRHSSLRGLSNEDIINLCNNDVEKICNLQLDIKAKLTLCDLTDKSLYIKFIRNDDQKAHNVTKVGRKNR